MTGPELRTARKRAEWTQVRLARSLGVTQAYVSLLEKGKREPSERLARTAVAVLDLPPTGLPSGPPPTGTSPTNDDVAEELSRLEYPGLAYRRTGAPKRNPADVLLTALAIDELDARLVEALPWILLRFEGLDFELLIRRAKVADLQNRLGFVLSLAREVAEARPAFRHRLADLRAWERAIEKSRLAREDTFGRKRLTERMRRWLRTHRSEAARHWNLLTDLKREHLPYAGANS